MAEQIQFYIRELQHQEGKLLLYKDSLDMTIKENDKLKQQVKALKTQLKDEVDRAEQFKIMIRDSKLNLNPSMDKQLRESIIDKFAMINKENRGIKKSTSKLIIKKKQEIDISNTTSNDHSNNNSSNSSNGRGRAKPSFHQRQKSDSINASKFVS